MSEYIGRGGISCFKSGNPWEIPSATWRIGKPLSAEMTVSLKKTDLTSCEPPTIHWRRLGLAAGIPIILLAAGLGVVFSNFNSAEKAVLAGVGLAAALGYHWYTILDS